jgi:hypothetical protein
MHAGNVGIKTDKLESLRIAVAKDSPMWETLDICIKIVDKNSLDLLVPRLAQMVRSAVGLNTRLGLHVQSYSLYPQMLHFSLLQSCGIVHFCLIPGLVLLAS